MINSLPHDTAEELLTLLGFDREMLGELVLAGLATVVTGTVQAGAPTIKVNAIASRTTKGDRRVMRKRTVRALARTTPVRNQPRIDCRQA
jgi:hypothetical protein